LVERVYVDFLMINEQANWNRIKCVCWYCWCCFAR